MGKKGELVTRKVCFLPPACHRFLPNLGPNVILHLIVCDLRPADRKATSFLFVFLSLWPFSNFGPALFTKISGDNLFSYTALASSIIVWVYHQLRVVGCFTIVYTLAFVFVYLFFHWLLHNFFPETPRPRNSFAELGASPLRKNPNSIWKAPKDVKISTWFWVRILLEILRL